MEFFKKYFNIKNFKTYLYKVNSWGLWSQDFYASEEIYAKRKDLVEKNFENSRKEIIHNAKFIRYER